MTLNAIRWTATASALSLAALAASPAAAATCKFGPATEVSRETGTEPYLMIDGKCTDPDYNQATFVVDKTEQATFQVPDGGPLIPYTVVTGHFPATRTLATLPAGIRQSPTTFQQNYEFRFPAKEFWRNRSFQAQHPSGGGRVDDRMAFTNGAFSIRWASASNANAVASHRHQAAATQVAMAMANKMYGNTAKIYNYHWGCSGGGLVAIAAAENVSGIWDGVQPHCTGAGGESLYHSFLWQAHYTMAIPEAKRNAIAEAAAQGGTGDVFAGLNDEEKAVLTEFISAGYPLVNIGNHFKNPIPLVDPVDIRLQDASYEDDFWTKPGYAGVNPPNYLKTALVDGWATITSIERDAAGTPIAVQFDPATLPQLSRMGQAYLEYWVYPDGKTRLVDPKFVVGEPVDQKRRFSLMGKLDTATARLALNGVERDVFGGEKPIQNSQALLDALRVGSKVRVNNRFILAMYFWPRHSNIPGARGHDQYRNADGSAKYPQRQDLSVLAHATFRTMGGRNSTGALKTRIMMLEGLADNLAWPIVNVSYTEGVQRTLGAAKANEMMRIYLHDNGSHSAAAGEPGIFRQSMQDMMAWAEKGVAPPPSSAYTIRTGQVILPAEAAKRGGLQPVMSLTANGASRVQVGVNQPVTLASNVEMPPRTGQVVSYTWTVDGKADPATVIAQPRTTAAITRTVSFDKPGSYLIRLAVYGQREGQANPANQTLLQNWREVRVIVQ